MPLPLTERNLCLFVAFLATEGLQAKSISVYLAALRRLQISAGHSPPPQSSWLWLHYVLRGVKLSQTARPRVRLPITAAVLTRLYQVWSSSGDTYRVRLLWATACLAFFGFFRLGEILPTTSSSPPPLLLSDVAVDSRSAPSLVRVTVRRAKNDPFGKGVDVYLGKTDQLLCPVSAMVTYLAIRPTSPGPLLVWCDSQPLLRDQFVQLVKAALTSAGVDHRLYSGHSFRIGAATSAATAGLPAHTIQAMGRWSSDAYLLYIRSSRESLAQVSRAIAAPHPP